MKKLLLSILFMTAAFGTKAQDAKPTKEETQKFIGTLLSKVIGEKSSTENMITTSQSFSSDFSAYHFADKFDNPNTFFASSDVRNIHWDDYLKCEGDKVDYAPNIMSVTLFFSSKVERENKIDNDKKVDNGYIFWVVIPVEKFASVEKALLRLSEIAKEENKDPFKN